MPLKGSKLAYYLKKKDPELYEKARRIKELFKLMEEEAGAGTSSSRENPGIKTS